MQTLWDLVRRTLYLSIFIIPIPFGAYTIHNGSSAVVALVSYMLLSFFMPFFYLRSSLSGFGPRKWRVSPYWYWTTWLAMQAATYFGFAQFDFRFLWSMPSVGRDVAFVVIMYWQVLFALTSAFVCSRLLARKGA